MLKNQNLNSTFFLRKFFSYFINYVDHIFTSTKGEKREYSFLSNKRRVANKRRVWKKYQNLINEAPGTTGGPGSFVTLSKEVFENSYFFRFLSNFLMTFSKINK